MSLYLVFGPFRACTDHRTKPRYPERCGTSEIQNVGRKEWSGEDPLEVARRAFESVLESTGTPQRKLNVIPFRR